MKVFSSDSIFSVRQCAFMMSTEIERPKPGPSFPFFVVMSRPKIGCQKLDLYEKSG